MEKEGDGEREGGMKKEGGQREGGREGGRERERERCRERKREILPYLRYAGSVLSINVISHQRTCPEAYTNGLVPKPTQG